jgi:hypothetical protein
VKPSDYGKYFWCVGLADEARSKIYAYADQVEISPSGCVVLRGPSNLINLAFQPGQWVFVYMCSPDDARPAAIELWPGMVEPQETVVSPGPRGLETETPSP